MKRKKPKKLITELRNYSGYSWLFKHKEGPFWSITECRQILIDNNGDMKKAKEYIDMIHAPKA